MTSSGAFSKLPAALVITALLGVVILDGVRVGEGRLVPLGEIALIVFVIVALTRPSWAIIGFFLLRLAPNIPLGLLPGVNVLTLGTIALAVAGVGRWSMSDRRIVASPLWAPILCLHAVLWVSSIYYLGSWGAPQLTILRQLVGFVAGPILFLYVLGGDLDRRGAVTVVAALIVLWAATAAQVIGIGLQGFLGSSGEFAAYVRRSSTVDEFYPATFIVSAAFMVSAVRLAPVEFGRWIGTFKIMLAALVVAVMLSSFLGALTGLIVSCGLALFLTWTRGRWMHFTYTAPIAFLALLILLAPLVEPAISVVWLKISYRLSLASGALVLEGPLAQRVSFWWPLAWAEFLGHPILGIGWNNSWRLLNGPFNLVLYILSLLGVVGGLAFSWWVFAFTRFFHQSATFFEEDPFWTSVALAGFAGLMGCLTFFMTQDGFLGSWSFLFYVFAALLTSAVRQRPNAELVTLTRARQR